MKRKDRDALYLIIRYIFLLLIGLYGLFIFYFIFSPMTIYPVFWFLSLFFSAALDYSLRTITLNDIAIKLIPACIAGAAYYLLLILNLSTPMNIKKRVKSISYLFFAFLILNIFRIIVFALLAKNNFQYIDPVHKSTWYFGSTALLILIWFSAVYIFKIKEIPVYSDYRNIIKDIKVKKRSR